MTFIRPLPLCLLMVCSLQACSPLPDWYLRHHAGQATQSDVVAEMGPPAKKEPLPDGGARWTYHDHVSYATYLTYSNPDSEVCYTYVLTFDARQVLQTYTKNSRNCGAVN
jgi:hypothetical protein